MMELQMLMHNISVNFGLPLIKNYSVITNLLCVLLIRIKSILICFIALSNKEISTMHVVYELCNIACYYCKLQNKYEIIYLKHILILQYNKMIT